MIERAAAAAGLELKAHPHMLRHACGYALANNGHDTRAIQGWLGHRSITSTAVYTALAPNLDCPDVNVERLSAYDVYQWYMDYVPHASRDETFRPRL
jgi:integrase